MRLPDLPDLRNRASLRERIADSLRAALITGDMVPGVTYSVPTLAERFGVSATPVREAMLDLVKEGMVRAVRNKGFRVVEVSECDLDEATEVQVLLEVPSVVGLTRRLSAAQLESLRDLAEKIQSAAAAIDLVAYIGADRLFHLELLALARNATLVRIVDQLRARSRLYGLGCLAAEGGLARSAGEHFELVGALETGPAAAVEKVMRHHIGHVRGMWANGAERPDGESEPA